MTKSYCWFPSERWNWLDVREYDSKERTYRVLCHVDTADEAKELMAAIEKGIISTAEVERIQKQHGHYKKEYLQVR